MAFALKLPVDVTRIIDGMYDLRLERVMREGGTPSCHALDNYDFEIDPPHPQYTCEAEGSEYVITERRRDLSSISPYPSIALYEFISPSYSEERLVVDLRASHGWDAATRPPRNRALNPPVIETMTRCIKRAPKAVGRVQSKAMFV